MPCAAASTVTVSPLIETAATVGSLEFTVTVLPCVVIYSETVIVFASSPTVKASGIPSFIFTAAFLRVSAVIVKSPFTVTTLPFKACSPSIIQRTNSKSAFSGVKVWGNVNMPPLSTLLSCPFTVTVHVSGGGGAISSDSSSHAAANATAENTATRQSARLKILQNPFFIFLSSLYFDFNLLCLQPLPTEC